jgi:PGF-CTERM protein
MRFTPARADCRPLALLLVVTLCVAAVPSGVAAATAGPAQSHGSVAGVTAASTATTDGTTITVEQGDTCYEVDPLGDGSQTVEEYYDYDVSTNYSSVGTTDLQENQVSNLLVYHGSEGYSLVLIHDKYGDGPYGGVASMTFTGLPTDGEWAVEDDGYDGRDDVFDHQGTRSEIDWMWYDDRNDGGAFRGLTATENVSITVDPAFNEDAAAWGEWNASGTENDRIEEWQLYTGPDETATLDMSESVTVANAGCDDPPSAALAAQPSTAAVGESVTLNASESTDDEGIAGYGWDFDGDGTVDLNTTTPTAGYTYDEAGDYEAAVTVRDSANNTHVATTTVSISDDGSDGDDGDGSDGDDGDDSDDSDDDESDVDGPDDVPVAALTGPTETTVGETVTLDASASTDDDGIQSYGWNVDGDTSIDRTTVEPTVETSFDEPGTHTVVVTVSDENGNEATAEHVIDVGAAETGPTGEIVVPEEATVGEPVTIEAANLSDDLAHVCWYFDGEAGPDGATAEHTFEETGTHEITLQLRDDQGRETTVTTQIDVVPADSEDGESGDDGDGSDDGDDGDSDDSDESDDGDNNDSDESGDDGDGSDDGDESDDGDSDDSDDSDESDDGDSDDSDDSDESDDGDSDDSDESGDGDESDDSDDGDESDDSDDGNSDDGGSDGGSDSGDIGDISLDPDVPSPLDSQPDDTDTSNDSTVSVADVRTTNETVDAGSSVEITVDFDETGNGTTDLPLALHRQRANGTDSVVDELSIGVPENGSDAVSVVTTLERPGQYRAAVGNRTADFSVAAASGPGDEPATDSEPESDVDPTPDQSEAAAPADEPADTTETSTDDTTTSANGPGFGALVAALGLVLAGLLAARRRA